MRFLRTTSTRRLLAAIAGLLVAVVAGTAIAIAAVGSGPVPPRKPLAVAVHNALSGRTVAGITARITFTNHLIDSNDIQGADPLLTGGSGRLWIAPGQGVRVEIQSSDGNDAELVIAGRHAWAYDPSSRTVYEAALPADRGRHSSSSKDQTPTIAQIQSVIARLAGHVTLSGAVPGDVAGQPAYTVRVSPKRNGGLLGGAALAFDAANGIPLRLAVFAKGERSPVLELKATDISFGAVPLSDIAITPPKNAKVVDLGTPALPAKAAMRGHSRHEKAPVTGANAVASHLGFALAAPSNVAGMQRTFVRLIGHGADAGAVVGYGHGLGGIYVLEHKATTQTKPGASSGEGRGLSLPTVSVGGASAQELKTPLGTVLRFTRGGVSYVVLGSVEPAAVEAAARSL